MVAVSATIAELPSVGLVGGLGRPNRESWCMGNNGDQGGEEKEETVGAEEERPSKRRVAGLVQRSKRTKLDPVWLGMKQSLQIVREEEDAERGGLKDERRSRGGGRSLRLGVGAGVLHGKRSGEGEGGGAILESSQKTSMVPEATVLAA